MPLHRRSAAQENKIRLYWAIFRIFIALTSCSFFLYFMASEVKSFAVMQSVYNAAQVGISVIHWISLSMDEEQCTVSLMRNETMPIHHIRTEYSGLYNYSYLQILQSTTFAALNAVIAECDRAGYITSEKEILQNQTNRLELMQQIVHSHPFEWDERLFNNFTTSVHNLRFSLLDIISKNVNYLDESIAHLSIVLQTLVYYIENLSLRRDSMVLLNEQGLNADRIYDRDHTIEYNQGTAIYYRALNQRLSGDLRDQWLDILDNPDWIHCNGVVVAMIHDSVYANFSFNRESWFNCTSTMVYDLQVLVENIGERLHVGNEEFRNQHLTSLIISVIGIILEFLAAGTLIHQAVPVIFLYAKFSAVVHSASVSGSLTNESYESKHIARSQQTPDSKT